MTPLQFLDENGRPVKLIEPMLITLASEIENYNKWLITVVERINEALHQALPGKTRFAALLHSTVFVECHNKKYWP